LVQNGGLTMGTNYIAPTWRMPENTNKDKLSNYSIDFDGADYIDCGDSDDFSFGNGSSDSPFTVSTWVYAEGSSTFPFFDKYPDAGTWSLREYRIEIFGTDKVVLIIYDGSETARHEIYSNSLITRDQWQHVVITYDGRGGADAGDGVKIYINGSESTTTINSYGNYVAMENTTSPVRIGRIGSTYADGKISQCCVFDYVLSENQRTYLNALNNPMAISGGEPIVYYPLGDNSNPTASAGYPNISVVADSVFNFAPNSFINCGDVNSVNSDGQSAFSISCWFKSTSTSGGSLVTKSKNSANFDGYQLWLDATGEVRFYLGSYTGTANTSPWLYVKSANQFNNGEWHNAVVTYNANQSTSGIKLYIDNVEQVLNVYNNAPSVSSSVQNDFMIGARGNSSANGFYYTGEISNVQFWDAKLEASEAETLYNNGQPLMTGTQPQVANLKAWYKLNQSSNWEADNVGDWQIPDVISAFPQSFNFIAANSDAIQFGPSNGLGFDTQISISAWFNQTPGGGNLQQLVAEDKTGSSRNWGIILVSKVPNFQFFDEAGVQVQLVGTALTEGKWHHILCTATGDTSTNGVKMYINGQLVAQGTASNNNIKNDNIQAKIGTQTASTPTYYFDGKISNVALWNTDRSSEKDNIYNNGTPATSYTTTPQYWYKLDNTSVWNPDPANYWTFPNAGEQDNSGIFNFSN